MLSAQPSSRSSTPQAPAGLATLQFIVVRHRHRHSAWRGTRVLWTLVAVGLVGGLVLWAAGIAFGIVIAALGAVGFVVAARLDVGPRGGHMHDDGMIGRGMPEAPRFPND